MQLGMAAMDLVILDDQSFEELGGCMLAFRSINALPGTSVRACVPVRDDVTRFVPTVPVVGQGRVSLTLRQQYLVSRLGEVVISRESTRHPALLHDDK